MTADSKKARPSCNSSGPSDQNPYQEELTMKNATTSSLNQTTDNGNTQNEGTGGPLKKLRESHGISITDLVNTGFSTASYILKVEANQAFPTKSYVAKYTEAVVKLMKAPGRGCAKVGCLGVNHAMPQDEDDLFPGWHTAMAVDGDEWSVSVDWFNNDTEWHVYGQLKDEETALDADKVESFFRSWRRADAYAKSLNRSGYVQQEVSH